MSHRRHPYPGPVFTEVVSGKLNVGVDGKAVQGSDIPVTRLILSSGAASSGPAFIVASGTASVDMGCPLHSNIPIEVSVDNLNRLYFVGDSTATVVQYYGER